MSLTPSTLVSGEGATALFWGCAWSVPQSQVAVGGQFLLFFTQKLLCLSALLLLLVWMQVMLLLFPRDYPFLTEPLSVLSRFWFWQLRNCPLPNSMGRPSILVPKSLVSSSFWEVTALRTGEELLMRGSKARLGDLIW